MELNIHVVHFNPWGDPSGIADGLVRTARVVEDIGAQGMTVMDHWPPAPSTTRCSRATPHSASWPASRRG